MLKLTVKEVYLKKLYKQFLEATIGFDDKKERDYELSFDEWLSKREIAANMYIAVLQELGINEDRGLIAEFESGYLESVSKILISLNYNPLLVTEYEKNQKSDHILHGRISYENNKVMIRSGLKKSCNINDIHVNHDRIETLITQAPYNIKTMKAFIYLLEENKDIFFGAYGNSYDKNKQKNIEQTSEIYKYIDKLGYGLYSEYIELDDCYAYSVRVLGKRRPSTLYYDDGIH